MRLEAEELFESKAEYFCEEGLVIKGNEGFRNEKELIRFEALDPATDPVALPALDNEHFDVRRFVDFFFEVVRDNVLANLRFAGVIGELVYHNERVSRLICEHIKLLPQVRTNPWPLIVELKNLKPYSALNFPVVQKCLEVFRGQLTLKLAATNEFFVSASRNFDLDEVVGYLNCMINKCLVFYLVEHRLPHLSEEKLEKDLKAIAIALDVFLHENSESVTRRLREVFDTKFSHMSN